MENQDAKKQETSVDFKSSAKNILNKVDEVSRPLGVMAWGLGELAAAKLAKLISKLIKAVKPLPGYVKELAEKWYLLLKKSVITPAKEDLQVLKNRVMVIVDGYKVSRETGNAEVKTAIARMKPYAKRWLQALMPFGSIALCALIINIGLNLNFVLKVEYNGEFVGYIENESTFDAAKLEVNSRVAQLDDDEFIKTPTYHLAVAFENDVADVETMTDNLILASGDEVTEASGLYVGGKFMGAVVDSAQAKLYMSSKLKDYENKYPDAVITFAGDTRLTDGLYPNESLISSDEMMALLQGETQTEKFYVVKKGDTMMEIANAHGMTTSELRKLNPDVNPKVMHSGTKLLLQASEPTIQVKVVYTTTYEEKIAYSTKRTGSSKYNVGYTKTTQKGVNGLKEVTAEVTLIDGKETNREVLASVVLKEPVTQLVTYGTRRVSSGGSYGGNVANLGTGRFKWPVGGNGGYISCYLWGYYGHTGIDIATSKGTPVYAADSGTVIKAVKQSYGYGWHIIIDHGNGFTTYYAHNSALFVKAGDVVTKGQHIANIGRTGNATGNHLHFEVRLNGKVKNPLNYL